MSTILYPSRWTLRTKLVASVLLLVIAIVMAVGALSVWQLHRTLLASVDSQLKNSAGQMSEAPAQGGEFLNYEGGGGDSLHLDLYQNRVLSAKDRTTGLMRQSAFLNQLGSPEPTPLTGSQIATLQNAGIGRAPSTVSLGSAGNYRVVAVIHNAGVRIDGSPRVTRDITTVIGLPLTDTDDSVHQQALAILLLSAAGLIVVGLGSAYLVERNLAPLRRVAATASRVSELPLSSGEVEMRERVQPRDTDERTEVGQVGHALNEMLDHVAQALTSRHASETRVRQFVADASHELRTPLASIRGYAELSRREAEPVPAGVRHALDRIESESDRMTALVEDLLLLARLDSGRPLDREPVDITLLSMETVSDAHAAGPDHQWKLDLLDEPMEVVGDEARIRQVLINLLANARRHTPAGTVVTTQVRTDGDDVLVTVADNGPGIEPDLLPHIFERFTRGDSARTRTEGSTGLGLSIVHAVVTAHGGGLSVQSQPGRTSFVMRLPRRSSAPAPTQSASR